jgi:hypothetical protein
VGEKILMEYTEYTKECGIYELYEVCPFIEIVFASFSIKKERKSD